MSKKCPKCDSTNIEVTEHNDLDFIKCKHCGFDEKMYEVTPSQRETQREKTRYSPYKTGGGKRTRK